MAADLETCRDMLRGGSRSFYAASFLLPARVRGPAVALYAFCRECDDAVDLGGGGEQTITALLERLDRIYEGRGLDTAVDRAFANVAARYGIPRSLPRALIEGFEWDAACRRYETIEDLHAYGARVAGTVGAMMSLLMGVRTQKALARACELGVAMQLTNIARDVGEDARVGRLYLPRQWMREAGIDPDAWMANPVHTPALAGVVQRLLDEAAALYKGAGTGVALLPADCRPGINAARYLYSGIGGEVRRRGLDSVATRAVVPPGRKAGLFALALLDCLNPSRAGTVGSLPAVRFLIDAAALPEQDEAVAVAWWNLHARLCRQMDMFERLARRDQAMRAAGRS